MWNPKNSTSELTYKRETDSQTQETNLRLPKGKSGRRDKLEVWDLQMHTTIYKIDKQQGFTLQHRELYLISYNKLQWKRIGKKNIDICIYMYNRITFLYT